jgi:hypothetical protein
MDTNDGIQGGHGFIPSQILNEHVLQLVTSSSAHLLDAFYDITSFNAKVISINFWEGA